jgi:hypothetical protein
MSEVGHTPLSSTMMWVNIEGLKWIWIKVQSDETLRQNEWSTFGRIKIKSPLLQWIVSDPTVMQHFPDRIRYISTAEWRWWAKEYPALRVSIRAPDRIEPERTKLAFFSELMRRTSFL